MLHNTSITETAEKSPRILVLCQLFYPELISTGQTLTELCERLSDMGVDIQVLCGPPTIVDRKSKIPRYLEYHNIRIRRVWGTRFPKLSFIGKLINQLSYFFSVFFNLLFNSSSRPILVVTNPPFLAGICALLRMFGGSPYIFLVFDVFPEMAVELGWFKKDGFIPKLWNYFNRFILRYSSTTIVIGRCMQEVIRGKVDYKLVHKIKRIHIWSDDNLIRQVPRDENPFIRKWSLDGKFVIIYSGNMGRFHDMETIMEAVKRLRDYKDIIFLFIGEGQKKRWMMEYAERWSLTNCQFHTYVNREDLRFSLSCADIGLASLARGQEGLAVPSKTFGLMAAGVPIVAIMSQDSEVARILFEEDCGVVIEQGNVDGLVDEILNFYNNRQRLELMGRNARLSIDRKYSLNKAVQFFYEVINCI